MLSDQNEKYSDRMERSYKALAVTFELRFPFPLTFDLQSRKVLFIEIIFGMYNLERQS